MSLESERLFRRLSEHSLVGVYIIQDGRYVYCNPKLAEVFGYTVDEVLALENWNAFVAPVDREMVLDRVNRRLSGQEEIARYSYRGVRKDGGIITVKIYGNRTELNGAPRFWAI